MYKVREIKSGTKIPADVSPVADLAMFFLDLVSETRIVDLSDEEVEFIIRVRYFRQGYGDSAEAKVLLAEVIQALEGLAPDGLAFSCNDEGYGYWPREES